MKGQENLKSMKKNQGENLYKMLKTCSIIHFGVKLDQL